MVEEVKALQSRPLDSIYPIDYLDCIHVKVRDGSVRVKAVYLAIGLNMAGEKEVLGQWIAQTEGAKFWLQVITEMKNRGVQDILFTAWMVSKDSRKPSRPSIPIRLFSSVSSIWCDTA